MTAVADRTALLNDAVTWTATTLPGAAAADPDLPTPCGDWSLVDLLLHMDDSLVAFHEAAGGHVSPPVPRHPATPAALVERLQFSACLLLHAWARPAPASVTIGELPLSTTLLLDTAALDLVERRQGDVDFVADAPDVEQHLLRPDLERAPLEIADHVRAILEAGGILMRSRDNRGNRGNRGNRRSGWRGAAPPVLGFRLPSSAPPGR